MSRGPSPHEAGVIGGGGRSCLPWPHGLHMLDRTGSRGSRAVGAATSDLGPRPAVAASCPVGRCTLCRRIARGDAGARSRRPSLASTDRSRRHPAPRAGPARSAQCVPAVQADVGSGLGLDTPSSSSSPSDRPGACDHQCRQPADHCGPVGSGSRRSRLRVSDKHNCTTAPSPRTSMRRARHDSRHTRGCAALAPPGSAAPRSARCALPQSWSRAGMRACMHACMRAAKAARAARRACVRAGGRASGQPRAAREYAAFRTRASLLPWPASGRQMPQSRARGAPSVAVSLRRSRVGRDRYEARSKRRLTPYDA